MRHRSATLVASFALLLAFGAVGTAYAQPRPAGPPSIVPKPNEPLTFDASGVKIKVSLVTSNLVAPWDIVFLPGSSDMLVTESNGKLRSVTKGALNPEPVWTAPTPKRNDVLHGLVLHPDFATNHFVYASHMKGDDKQQTIAISRGKLENGKLVDVKEIFVADAWENAGMAIAGRMIFSPDKKLFIEVGDRDPLCCQPVDDNHVRMRAQSLADDVGKVLRLNDDGTPAKDNPFVGRKDAKPEIYSYGHRNGYGFAYHPETGELWELEIGPMGGDEINVLKPGANYGWPLVSMGRNYSGTLVSDQPFSRPGMENPRVFWVPSISPSGLMFYTGDKFGPTWKNSLFVGALSGQHLERLAFGLPGQAERREILLADLRLRFRDIETGPDGNIYVATEVRYGSGQPDGAILKIEPAGQ